MKLDYKKVYFNSDDKIYLDILFEYIAIISQLEHEHEALYNEATAKDFLEVYGKCMKYIHDNINYNYKDEVQYINDIMHQLHSYYKLTYNDYDLRKLAIKEFWDKDIEIELLGFETYWNQFPKDIKNKIDELIKSVDDIAVVYTTTWYNYHGPTGKLIHGNNFVESPVIQIRYINEQDANKALDIISQFLKEHKYEYRVKLK